MRSTIERARAVAFAVVVAALAAMTLSVTAAAQSISTQAESAGLSIGSLAEPGFFSPARNTECEANPIVNNCDSFIVTVRNEGGQSTGVVPVGETQACDPGLWENADPTNFKFQWLRELVGFEEPKIVGEEQNYTPQSGDKEFTLVCRVTAINTLGSSTVGYSQPLRVAPLPRTAFLTPGLPTTVRENGNGFASPEIYQAGSGQIVPASSVAVGEALVCDPGDWRVQGNTLGSKIRLRYRWLVGGKPTLSDGTPSSEFTTAQTFIVPLIAEGQTVQCEVSATLETKGGQSYAASGRAVVGPPPAEEAPRISGGILTLVTTPAITGASLVLKDTLPAGVTAVGIRGVYFTSTIEQSSTDPSGRTLPCDLPVLSCTLPVPILPGQGMKMEIYVTTQETEGEIASNFAEVFDGASGLLLRRSTTEEPPGKVVPVPVSSGEPPFSVRSASLQAFGSAGAPDLQAGSRPNTVTSGIQFPTVAKGPIPGEGAERANVPPKSANVRDIRITLPPGLVGNPLATLRCSTVSVAEEICPVSGRVGAFKFIQDGRFTVGDQNLAVFNVLPEEGYPAQFGGIYLGRFVGIYANLVRAPVSKGGYTVQVTVPGVPLISPITNTLATFFGDPAGRLDESPGGPALLTNPSDCGTNPATTIEADTWQEIGEYKSRVVPFLPEGKTIANCSLLQFGPSIDMDLETTQADTPSGFGFDLSVPQAPEAGPSLGTPPLKDAVVTLPRGIAPSPAQADGLEACTPAQIDLDGEAIDGFGHDDGQPHPTPGNCPPGSKIATAKITTPLLSEPVNGSVYLGTPDCSPCTDADAQAGKLIKLYIEARDRRYGLVVKLAGEAKANPAEEGRLTATFLNGPQFPFSKVELDFKGGPRAALSTPLVCDTYSITSKFTPWSAPETPDATPASSFEISSGAGGSGCVSSEAQAPNAPSFEAGVINALAGSYSPFVLRLNRADGTQRIKSLNLTLPPGLTGKLAGIPACSDAALAAAEGRSGKAEQASSSCPVESQVGTVDVAAGAGPQPLHVQGRAYVSGPYKGAPLSMAIVTPAVAGPFDLGTVVVRTALYVNPATAQIIAKSDPFPSILGGVPVNLRSAVVKFDRTDFTLNPTSCEAMAITGEAISFSGGVAPLSNRFQVGGCKGLPFGPKLSLRLMGGTKRGAHPRLRAVLTAKPGEANIAKTSVTLPRSEFLDQGHIRTVCTRVQFAADQCPKGSIYGHVRALTPLLDEPLEGPVYLRSSDNELPDAVGVLKGPASRPIQIEAVARIDSFRRGIRANFETIPDAPISKVIVTMQGGRKGLLINSANLCKIKVSARRATVKMDGQNGKHHDFKPVVQNDCGKGRKVRGSAR